MKTHLLLLVPVLALAGCRSVAAPGTPGNPSVYTAAREVTGSVPPSRGFTRDWLPCLDEAVDRARVVLVGEYHDQRPHHDVERDVLARMSSTGGTVLLGMEMFQRPSQAALDDYVAGRIDEVEMLRKTEYYTRWGFDHTYYAPLWRLCRARGIRIVALNPDGQINRKVGREGIDALTPAERSGIAAEVDTRVASHRERIVGNVFGDGGGGHGAMTPQRREFMYQAMCVWDDTMAESAARALAKAGDGSRMLIVAGAGHIMGFDGIHDRLVRRMPGLSALVVVCDTDYVNPLDPYPASRRAHFTVCTQRDDRPGAPLLGVRFKDGSLTADSVAPGGNADRMGLKAGDTIAALAGPDGVFRTTRDLTDLKYELEELWAAGGKGGLVRLRRADGSTAAKPFDLVAPGDQD